MESENRHCFHEVPQYHQPAGCSGSQQIGKPPPLQAVLPAIGKDWENSTVAKKNCQRISPAPADPGLRAIIFLPHLIHPTCLGLSAYFIGDMHVSLVGDGFNLLSFKLLKIWYHINTLFCRASKGARWKYMLFPYLLTPPPFKRSSHNGRAGWNRLEEHRGWQ